MINLAEITGEYNYYSIRDDKVELINFVQSIEKRDRWIFTSNYIGIKNDYDYVEADSLEEAVEVLLADMRDHLLHIVYECEHLIDNIDDLNEIGELEVVEL